MTRIHIPLLAVILCSVTACGVVTYTSSTYETGALADYGQFSTESGYMTKRQDFNVQSAYPYHSFVRHTMDEDGSAWSLFFSVPHGAASVSSYVGLSYSTICDLLEAYNVLVAEAEQDRAVNPQYLENIYNLREEHGINLSVGYYLNRRQITWIVLYNPEDAGLKDLQDYPYALRGYGAHPDTMRDLLTKAIETIEALGVQQSVNLLAEIVVAMRGNLPQ